MIKGMGRNPTGGEISISNQIISKPGAQQNKTTVLQTRGSRVGGLRGQQNQSNLSSANG